MHRVDWVGTPPAVAGTVESVDASGHSYNGDGRRDVVHHLQRSVGDFSDAGERHGWRTDLCRRYDFVGHGHRDEGAHWSNNHQRGGNVLIIRDRSASVLGVAVVLHVCDGSLPVRVVNRYAKGKSSVLRNGWRKSGQ